METDRKPIKSFRDLDVYENLYKVCLVVMKEILPHLPKCEQHDLRNQLSRSAKAAPRLIAEGYAKRHQHRGFQKYLDDAMAECNETIVGLEMCRDIYGSLMPTMNWDSILDIYDKSGRQIYNLAKSWSRFKDVRRSQ